MTLFALNLTAALTWSFLSGGNSFVGFVVGYTAGFALLWWFRRYLPDDRYVRRTLAFLVFTAAFGREFLLSTLAILKAVLFGRRGDLYPNFITYHVADLTHFEILVLSHCITLTPGTTSVSLSDDWAILVVHAFDARDPQAVRDSIDRGLRQPLLAFTR